MADRHDRQFTLYATLAAAAALSRSEFGILFHTPEPANVFWTTLVYCGAALAVLFRPADPRLLLLLLATEVLDVWYILPMSPNHWLLSGVVAVGWLIGAASLAFSAPFPKTGGPLLAAVLRPLRVGVVLFYLFTGFWKLNGDFADITHSCGVRSWDRLVAQFPLLPHGAWVGHGVVAFTLALELGLPLFLLVRRTRGWALVIFAFFHAVLALDYLQNYQNFSWTMFALLALFLEPETVDRVASRAPTLVRLFPWARALLAVFWVGLCVATWFTSASFFWHARFAFAAPAAWVWFAVLAFVALPPPTPLPAPRAVPAAWLFVALVVANGLSPILGLKNRNSWQMYSNIRIEPDFSNHWIVPRSIDLLGYQSDTADVLASDDPELAALVDGELHPTWHDLRTYAASHPDVSLTYRHHGVVRADRRVGDDPDLSAPPYLSRKLAWFRPLGPRVAEQCVW